MAATLTAAQTATLATVTDLVGLREDLAYEATLGGDATNLVLGLPTVEDYSGIAGTPLGATVAAFRAALGL